MIALPRKVYDQMIAHAKAGFPNEACGLLAGSPGHASVFYPMRNIDNATVSYFMDSRELLQVMKRMRSENVELCGIFHSHVNSEAYPSAKDIELAFYGDAKTEIFPQASYLIVSLSDFDRPALRSFRISEKTVAEEKVEIA